jgi:dihydrofolate reductase
MRELIVFNHVSLDGFFVDQSGDMSWAKVGADDPEWAAFLAENATGGAELVFGRITYDLMVSYWPTPLAAQQNPVVAERMNHLPKVVFSRTLDRVSWSNARLVRGDLVAAVRGLKQEPGDGLVILGSGRIVAQLAPAGLIDQYQVVVNPIVLGRGRTMFDGVRERLGLKLTRTRAFANGNVFLCYQPMR